MNYATPQSAPTCRCAVRGGLAPMLCNTGHMLECHHPLTCDQAACNHLQRYTSMEVGELAAREEQALLHLVELADPDCSTCHGVGYNETTTSVDVDNLEVPAEPEPARPQTLEFVNLAICVCVVTR